MLLSFYILPHQEMKTLDDESDGIPDDETLFFNTIHANWIGHRSEITLSFEPVTTLTRSAGSYAINTGTWLKSASLSSPWWFDTIKDKHMSKLRRRRQPSFLIYNSSLASIDIYLALTNDWIRHSTLSNEVVNWKCKFFLILHIPVFKMNIYLSRRSTELRQWW